MRNSILKFVGVLALAVALFATLPARADQVILANGDRLTGSVSTIYSGRLLLTTEHLGTLDIPMEQVASIDKSEPLLVTTEGGEVVEGVLSVEDGAQTLVTDSGSQPLILADLSQAVEDLSAAQSLDFSWNSNLDFGYVLSTGNSETESTSLHFDSVVNRGQAEHRLFAYWNRDEADSETTRDTLDSGYDFRWYFREKWYALGSIGYFQDQLKEIDQRITVGAGVGYQFFDTTISSLSTELGISQVFEELAGENESNPAVRWAVDYNRWLKPEAIDYFYGHEVLKILDSDRGEIYKMNTGIRFTLSERWNANARVDLVHETDPPPDREKTDLTYSLGLGFVF